MLCVTHPGNAHRDDFLSCCLLLAAGKIDRIERREPTEADLADPDTYVVDVGGQHDRQKKNYDHHQLPRDAEPCCALTLVMRGLWMNRDIADMAWPWLRFTEVLDSKGPTVAAELVSIPRDNMMQLISPVESALLQMFASCSTVPDSLLEIMSEIGKTLMDQHHRMQERQLAFDRHLTCQVTGDIMFAIVDFEPDNHPTFGLEAYLSSRRDVDVPVTVTRDVRGNGWSLYRRNDDPRIDFTRIKDDPSVAFAHTNGFLATTKELVRVDELCRLISLSTKHSPPTVATFHQYGLIQDAGWDCRDDDLWYRSVAWNELGVTATEAIIITCREGAKQ